MRRHPYIETRPDVLVVNLIVEGAQQENWRKDRASDLQKKTVVDLWITSTERLMQGPAWRVWAPHPESIPDILGILYFKG